MSGTRNITGWVVMAALLCGAAIVVEAQAQTSPVTKTPAPRPKGTPPPEPPSPDQSLENNWKAAATPGDEHKILQALVGKWKSHIVVRVNPNRASEETDGTSEGTMLLGGRYLEVTHKSTLSGQPFEGIMLTGY